MHVGVAGLGKMGSAIARNVPLIERGAKDTALWLALELELSGLPK